MLTHAVLAKTLQREPLGVILVMREDEAAPGPLAAVR